MRLGGHPSLELGQRGKLNGSSLKQDTLLSASGVDAFAGAAVGLGVAAPVSLAKETIVYNLMNARRPPQSSAAHNHGSFTLLKINRNLPH